jgi:hypothetical protein
VQCQFSNEHELIYRNGQTYQHGHDEHHIYWSTIDNRKQEQPMAEEPNPYSNTTRWVADPSEPNGGRYVRMTWKERYEQEKALRRESDKFRQILADLDRNENGRHEGDADVGTKGGVSLGNPMLQTGEVLGYDIGGRVYVMPDRANRHKADAWGPFDPE